MTDNLISYELESGLAQIILAAPETGNVINMPMVEQLLKAVQQAARDDARVVVLSSSGSQFSYGGDISAFAARAHPPAYIEELASVLHRAIAELQALDAICVSVVRGVAAGAGVGLALAADLVIASELARLTLGYSKIGLTPDGGNTLSYSSMGLHQALRFALLNPVLSAREAHSLGLIAEIYEDDLLDSAVATVVKTLLNGSRTAQVAAKRLIRAQSTPAAIEARRLETIGIRTALASPDGREGVAAFLAKRKPIFNEGATA